MEVCMACTVVCLVCMVACTVVCGGKHGVHSIHVNWCDWYV